MNSAYIKALETKADWLDWLARNSTDSKDEGVDLLGKTALTSDNTYFMNARFAELVDHARRSIPDDVLWDNTWVQTPTGFLWVESEFALPKFELDLSSPRMMDLVDAIERKRRQGVSAEELDSAKRAMVTIPAIGWMPIMHTHTLDDGRTYGTAGNVSRVTDATAFLCMFDNRIDRGFSPWAYFTIKTGDRLIDKIRQFEKYAEKQGGSYTGDRTTDLLHEVRWIYTAFHLMSQKLAIGFDVDTDRATRRRAERENKCVPSKFKVVSLRRMEAAKVSDGGEHLPVDWQWRWTVRGHWRNQWCASTKTHKQVFVEAYIKGPDDKPLKDPSEKIFTAVR